MTFIHASDIDEPHAGQVEVSGSIVLERPKALRFKASSGVVAWLPKAKIVIERGKASAVTIFMPQWLAKDRGYV